MSLLDFNALLIGSLNTYSYWWYNIASKFVDCLSDQNTQSRHERDNGSINCQIIITEVYASLRLVDNTLRIIAREYTVRGTLLLTLRQEVYSSMGILAY